MVNDVVVERSFSRMSTRMPEVEIQSGRPQTCTRNPFQISKRHSSKKDISLSNNVDILSLLRWHLII
jgi:hypothetical protein